MKTNKALGRVGITTVLLAGLTGCTTYVVQRPDPQPAYLPPQSAPVIVQQAPQPAPVIMEQAPPPPPPVVVIQQDDDFVQPLSPYGDWVTVADYGRCWRPARVEAGWRPYANGHWELTPDGWYWVSDEPWAWDVSLWPLAVGGELRLGVGAGDGLGARLGELAFGRGICGLGAVATGAARGRECERDNCAVGVLLCG